MKIIKYGQNNQKKFVCRCGCEFVADKTDLKYYHRGTHINWGEPEEHKELTWEESVYVNCPMCANEHIWANGETYNN